MIGRTLGHYRILEQIGKGYWADAYRAHDERLERDVVVRVLIEFAHPIVSKLELVASLTHPNIASLLGLEVLDGRTCLISEFVIGTTLEEKLTAGPLRPAQAVGTIVQVASALESAHEHGILHLRLTPRKVRITQDGTAKVLDCGLAMAIKVDAEYEIDCVEARDASALPYMAPDKAPDERSDVWSLGVLLYELATGYRPFTGRTGTIELLESILHKQPAPPPAELPAKIRSAIRRCLEKESSQRYQRVREVRAALEAA